MRLIGEVQTVLETIRERRFEVPDTGLVNEVMACRHTRISPEFSLIAMRRQNQSASNL